jgi:ribosomal protein S14
MKKERKNSISSVQLYLKKKEVDRGLELLYRKGKMVYKRKGLKKLVDKRRFSIENNYYNENLIYYIKKNKEKNKEERNVQKKNKKKRVINNFVIKNEIIKYGVRCFFIERNMNMSRNNSIVRYKNKCHITLRNRGNLRYLNISRIMFKELAKKGELFGIKKR